MVLELGHRVKVVGHGGLGVLEVDVEHPVDPIGASLSGAVVEAQQVQRPCRTTTAHGSTSACHSLPDLERYPSAPAPGRARLDERGGDGRVGAGRAPVGRRGRGPADGGRLLGHRRGQARRILASALPTGSSSFPAGWWPSSTAITSPSASLAVNVSGGRRSPRPSR